MSETLFKFRVRTDKVYIFMMMVYGPTFCREEIVYGR